MDSLQVSRCIHDAPVSAVARRIYPASIECQHRPRNSAENRSGERGSIFQAIDGGREMQGLILANCVSRVRSWQPADHGRAVRLCWRCGHLATRRGEVCAPQHHCGRDDGGGSVGPGPGRDAEVVQRLSDRDHRVAVPGCEVQAGERSTGKASPFGDDRSPVSAAEGTHSEYLRRLQRSARRIFEMSVARAAHFPGFS